MWNTEALLRSFEGKKAPKMLFLSATEDEVIPSDQMKALFTISRKFLKSTFFIHFDNCGHNDTWEMENYFQCIDFFVNQKEEELKKIMKAQKDGNKNYFLKGFI
eukprot:GHVN01080622.1.p1 GENE.GHVN01080622.1~~GHVN01080622.1.p1  ORF type:complete len:104 (-),score=15.60 GHVN01080622.1:253-564(-)